MHTEKNFWLKKNESEFSKNLNVEITGILIDIIFLVRSIY